jgi:hypothetical protein
MKCQIVYRTTLPVPRASIRTWESAFTEVLFPSSCSTNLSNRMAFQSKVCVLDFFLLFFEETHGPWSAVCFRSIVPGQVQPLCNPLHPSHSIALCPSCANFNLDVGQGSQSVQMVIFLGTSFMRLREHACRIRLPCGLRAMKFQPRD